MFRNALLKYIALIWVTLMAFGICSISQAQSRKSAEQERVVQGLQDIGKELRRSNEPDETAKPCKPDEEDRNSDLCAQWKAADAAEDSASSNRYQVWIAGGGLAVGVLTLIAAVAAAKFARDAAKYTKDGADATDRSIEETRRIGEAQTRAYVVPLLTGMSWGNAKDSALFMGEWHNSGQSPADNVTIDAVFHFKNEKGEDRSVDMYIPSVFGKIWNLSALHKEQLTFRAKECFSANQIAEFCSGKGDCRIKVHVKYMDVFQVERARSGGNPEFHEWTAVFIPILHGEWRLVRTE